MSKKEEEEEVYRLTLKGLIYLNLGDNELAGKIVDSIELYLRRHHSKGGHPAIVFNMDDNRFDFVTLRNSEDE
jgi:hypothetical protein